MAEIEADVAARVGATHSVDTLRGLETSVLGKTGSLGSLIKAIRDFPTAKPGHVGKTVNEAKNRVQTLVKGRLDELQAKSAAAEASEAEAFDPTLPGLREPMGSVHPVTAVQWEFERAFERLGFTIEAEPEMETEYDNFEALNIPASHFARDMRDTFRLAEKVVLWTRTSPERHRSRPVWARPES